MPRTFKRVIVGISASFALLAAGLTVAVAARQHRTFEAPYPDIHASRDPAVIERGRYLAFGLAHCADCHATPGSEAALAAGREVPLSGGREFRLPVGVFRVPNITTDRNVGIGRYSDPELARMLRHGVRPNGEALVPFMPFADLSNEDLTALISFLRTQPAASHAVPEHEVNALGQVIKAFVLEPRGPSETEKKRVEREASPEYGRYLAHSVANCVGCHTKIDMRTGAFAGPLFGGGAEHPSNDDPKQLFVSPNLTPDPTSGWLNGWSEDAFVARLTGGRVHHGSPMPWEAFSRMSADDARAIFRYLRALPPAAGGPSPADRRAVLPVATR